MQPIVPDASVVVKWYIPEQHYQQSRALRDDFLTDRHGLLAPTLLPFEVVNALKYSGHYEGDRLPEASNTLPEYGITLIPYHKIGSVAEIAIEMDITIYEASYIALASANNANMNTADTRLLDAITETSYADHCLHIKTYEP